MKSAEKRSPRFLSFKGERTLSPRGRGEGEGDPKWTRIRRLRTNATDAERLLWAYLRRGGMGGLKFKRQQPMGPFIADFICFEKRLVIELDGGHHAEQRTADDRRDHWFIRNGYRVLRFWNAEVKGSLSIVLDRILEETQSVPSPLKVSSPSPRRANGARRPSPSGGEGFAASS